MLKKHGQVLLTVLYVNDLLIVIISWLLAYYFRFHSGFFNVYFSPQLSVYLYALPFIFVIWPVVFKLSKLYNPKRNVSLWDEFYSIVSANTLALFLLVSFSFFFYRQYSYSRMLIAIFFLFSLVLFVLSRIVLRNLIRYFRAKGYNLKHVVIVGAGDLGIEVACKINQNPWAGFNFVGWLDDYKEVGSEVKGKPVLGRCKDVKRCLAENDVDVVFIALPVQAYRRVFYMVKKLELETVDVKVVPNLYQVVTLNASIEDFDGLPTINITESPIYGWNQAIKRIFDILVSLMALTVTAPLLVLAAVLIKWTSRGPVFFKQVRYGLGGKKVEVYKLRSMVQGDKEQADRLQATRNDPRVTSVGRFLRRTSIDELPQFFNVLKGEMSVVGPRPHPLHLDDKNKELLETYMWRYKVKPGITGWAQVNGWRGETDTLEKMKRRVEHDIYYIEHWSAWFDVKIMLMTVWKGLINRNAY